MRRCSSMSKLKIVCKAAGGGGAVVPTSGVASVATAGFCMANPRSRTLIHDPVKQVRAGSVSDGDAIRRSRFRLGQVAPRPVVIGRIGYSTNGYGRETRERER